MNNNDISAILGMIFDGSKAQGLYHNTAPITSNPKYADILPTRHQQWQQAPKASPQSEYQNFYNQYLQQFGEGRSNTLTDYGSQYRKPMQTFSSVAQPQEQRTYSPVQPIGVNPNKAVQPLATSASPITNNNSLTQPAKASSIGKQQSTEDRVLSRNGIF